MLIRGPRTIQLAPILVPRTCFDWFYLKCIAYIFIRYTIGVDYIIVNRFSSSSINKSFLK